MAVKKLTATVDRRVVDDMRKLGVRNWIMLARNGYQRPRVVYEAKVSYNAWGGGTWPTCRQISVESTKAKPNSRMSQWPVTASSTELTECITAKKRYKLNTVGQSAVVKTDIFNLHLWIFCFQLYVTYLLFDVTWCAVFQKITHMVFITNNSVM